MPTIIHKLPYVNAASVGIAPIDISDAELALFAAPELLYWWRADTGLTSTAWACRKTGKTLVKERTNMPSVQTLAAYNSKPSLLFSDTSQLYDGGQNLCPIGGDMSFVAVGRAGTEDSAFLVGGAGTGLESCMLVHQSTVATLGTIRASFRQAGGTIANYSVESDSPKYYADGPNLIIGSHAPFGTIKQALTVNDVSKTGSPALSGVANTAPELHVGGVNAFGAAIAGGLTGDLAEIMVFNVALHLRTDLRALAQTYTNARYTLW